MYLVVQNGHQPPPDVTKSWSRESRLLLQQWESLCIKNGILWRRRCGGKETNLQLVLPTEFQVDVLLSLHEGAMLQHLEMLQQLKDRFYWPGCGLLCNVRYMLHTEISCPKAEGRSINNPCWIPITSSLCGHNGSSSRNRSRK